MSSTLTRRRILANRAARRAVHAVLRLVKHGKADDETASARMAEADKRKGSR